MTLRMHRAPIRYSNKKPDKPMDDKEIVAFLQNRIQDSLNDEDGSISNTRQRLFDRYVGKEIPTEKEGGTSYRDMASYELVQDVIPGIMGVLTSSRRIVEFNPRNAEDIPTAEQETEAINYWLMQRSNGYLELETGVRQMVIDPVVYFKVDGRHVERTVHHDLAEVTPMQMIKLFSPERVWKKDLRVDKIQEPGNPEERYMVKGTEVKMDPEIFMDLIPPNNMLIDRGASFVDLDSVWDDYGFICHMYDSPLTELVKRGFDEDSIVEAGGSNFEVRFDQENVNRKFRDDETPLRSQATDYSTRRYTVYECYIKMDVDGSGVADGWRITLVGDTILEKKRISEHPFIAASLIPIAFKHAGMSPAEVIEQVQKVKQKLVRIAVNSAYRADLRKMILNRQARLGETIDQIQDAENAVTEVKGPPAQNIMYEPPPANIEPTLAMIRYFDELLVRRTGVRGQSSIPPEVLADSTAHGLLLTSDNTSHSLMHFVRIIVETFLKKAALKAHTALRRYQDKALMLKLRGEWVEVDPGGWHERTEITAAAGLGFNSTQQKLAALTQVIAGQEKGLENGMSDLKRIHTTLDEMVTAGGLGHIGKYYIDPASNEFKPPPSKPDPQAELVKLQEETKLKIAELEAETQKERIKVETLKEKNRATQLEFERLQALGRMATEELDIDKAQAEVDESRSRTALNLAKIMQAGADIDTMLKQAQDTSGESTPENSTEDA